MQRESHDVFPQLGGAGIRQRAGVDHMREDLGLLLQGKTNLRSIYSSNQFERNPTELLTFSGPKMAKLGCSLIYNSEGKAEWYSDGKLVNFSEKRWPQDEEKLRAMGAEFVEPKSKKNGEIIPGFWRYHGARLNLDELRWKAALKGVSRQHNLRTTMGRDQWQRLHMFGNITANATSYTGASGAATATSATSLTNSGAAFPTSGGPNGSLQGQVVVAMVAGTVAVWGVIMSNTATVLTIDQWYSASSSSGAAGSTPGSTTEYWVTPWGSPALWIGLSTNSAAAAAGDVLRTSDGLFGDGSTGAAATEQNSNGLTRVFVQPTFPSAGNIQLQNTWTYTGSSSVTIAKAVLCNSKVAAGSLLVLETLTSATATVSANGDTIQLTWTITL